MRWHDPIVTEVLRGIVGGLKKSEIMSRHGLGANKYAAVMRRIPVKVLERRAKGAEARTMADKKNHDEHLKKIVNYLADTVLGLSDEAILAEVSAAGGDPGEESVRTRFVLCKASQVWENVNRRLSYLGHTITPTNWQRRHGVYHNRCLKCDSAVSFATATGESQGKALETPCRAGGQYTLPRQELSRK